MMLLSACEYVSNDWIVVETHTITLCILRPTCFERLFKPQHCLNDKKMRDNDAVKACGRGTEIQQRWRSLSTGGA